MREVVRGTQFKRDIKLAEMRGKDFRKLRATILLLIEGKPLPARMCDHGLSGGWKHHRDLHIEPDWLLIYKLDNGILHLVRTGTHADLFR